MRITTAWLIGTGLHEGLTLAQVYAHKPGEIIDLYSQEDPRRRRRKTGNRDDRRSFEIEVIAWL